MLALVTPCRRITVSVDLPATVRITHHDITPPVARRALVGSATATQPNDLPTKVPSAARRAEGNPSNMPPGPKRWPHPMPTTITDASMNTLCARNTERHLGSAGAVGDHGASWHRTLRRQRAQASKPKSRLPSPWRRQAIT